MLRWIFPTVRSAAYSGKSGIGKSTLAKVLCGICPPDQGNFSGRSMPRFTECAPMTGSWAFPFQMVYQQPYATLDPHQKIGSGFKELIRYHELCSQGKGADADGRRACEGRAGTADPDPPAASDLRWGSPAGGYARCLLFRPKLLILDEATSMLDVSTQANVLGMVRRQMQ